MKSLGYMNDWHSPMILRDGKWEKKSPDRVPAEYTACVAAGHVAIEKSVGRCLTHAHCPICQIEYMIDSSD